MLSQDNVEDQLRKGKYDYLAIFEDEVRAALQEWFSLVATLPEIMAGALPRERATFLNRRAVERICKALDGNPDVVITFSHQSILITINNQITLRFKKLSRFRRTMSIRTTRVKRLWYKNMQSLPGQFEEWINVTFGWRLSGTGTITELAVVNEFNDQLQWIILITDDGGQQTLPNQLPLPVLPSNEPDVFVAKLRDTERARRIAKEKAAKGKNEA